MGGGGGGGIFPCNSYNQFIPRIETRGRIDPGYLHPRTWKVGGATGEGYGSVWVDIGKLVFKAICYQLQPCYQRMQERKAFGEGSTYFPVDKG